MSDWKMNYETVVAENEEHRQYIAELEAHIESLQNTIAQVTTENERLHEACKALGHDPNIALRNMHDAERYRWLQKGYNLEYMCDEREAGRAEGVSGLNKAIDAAMEDT